MAIWQYLVPRPMPSLLFSSMMFSILLSFSIYIAIRVLKVRDPKFISVLFIAPMFVPLVIYAISFSPSSIFPLRMLERTLDLIPQIKGGIMFGNFIKGPYLGTLGIQYLLLTDTLCLIGLTFGPALLVFTYVFGGRIICKLQGVVELMPQEYPELVFMTQRLVERAGVSMPRLGIAEDLRPNAFTIGWGRKAMIVVTLGLLNMLDGDELEAVLAHEIAHIKNQDFHFMTLISSLRAISFFNPLVYILSPVIRKERELFADTTGTKLLESPEVFGLALKKIWDASKILPRDPLKQLISGLFIVSEIRHAKNFLATHPTLENRLSSINESRMRATVSKRDMIKTILICGVVISIVLCTLGLIAQTFLPVMRMNVIGPERIWYSSIDVPSEHVTNKFGLYPPTMTNSNGFPPMRLHLDYPWVLNTIYMLMILIILLKIWRPLENSTGNQSAVVSGVM